MRESIGGADGRSDDALGSSQDTLEICIGSRLREFRIARSLTLAALAAHSGVSKAMLSKIEHAQTSSSLATLTRLAEALDVPVTAFFRGFDTEREVVFTPSGGGSIIIRRGSRAGHQYQLLGTLRGRHKQMETLLVTLDEASEVFPQFQHPGTEFLYMLDGELTYSCGDAQYTLRPGDSLIFDGQGPHGPIELRTLPIRFLSVTAFESHRPQSSEFRDL